MQVGAFADVFAANEVRRKLEGIGLKTYTQAVNTKDGQRIRVRVGPFTSRDEAQKAADRAKKSGLGRCGIDAVPPSAKHLAPQAAR